MSLILFYYFFIDLIFIPSFIVLTNFPRSLPYFSSTIFIRSFLFLFSSHFCFSPSLHFTYFSLGTSLVFFFFYFICIFKNSFFIHAFFFFISASTIRNLRFSFCPAFSLFLSPTRMHRSVPNNGRPGKKKGVPAFRSRSSNNKQKKKKQK